MTIHEPSERQDIINQFKQGVELAVRGSDVSNPNRKWSRALLAAIVEDDFDGDPLHHGVETIFTMLSHRPHWPAIERGVRLSIDRHPSPLNRGEVYGVLIRNLHYIETYHGKNAATYQQMLSFIGCVMQRHIKRFRSPEWAEYRAH